MPPEGRGFDVVLKPGKEGAVLGRHPWIFSGAIRSVPRDMFDGAEVRVLAHDGRFLARGLFNGASQIRVRVYRWEDAPLDGAFFVERVRNAVDLRRTLLGLDDPRGAARLIFSEGDGLSGLTVDRYGPYLSVQFTSKALYAAHRDPILGALQEAVQPAGIVLRTEKGILDEEGLELRDGVLDGAVPEEPFEIDEGGLRFGVDLRTGHKTGFYLDQRENRARVARYAAGRSVADVCCYTGGFGLYAAAAGAAAVVGVDASQRTLDLAGANARRNGLSGTDFERGDAFRWLEAAAEEGRRFGLVVLDPPRFARSRRGVPSALKAYERLNTLALRCLEPGGVLATFSCSGRVSAEAFAEAVGRASARAGRPLRILERLGQAPDHPVQATCPETTYLKGLIAAAE